jgi:hypothetical protein
LHDAVNLGDLEGRRLAVAYDQDQAGVSHHCAELYRCLRPGQVWLEVLLDAEQ